MSGTVLSSGEPCLHGAPGKVGRQLQHCDKHWASGCLRGMAPYPDKRGQRRHQVRVVSELPGGGGAPEWNKSAGESTQRAACQQRESSCVKAPKVGGVGGFRWPCLPKGRAREVRRIQPVKVLRCSAGEFGCENYGESLEGLSMGVTSVLSFQKLTVEEGI